MRKDPPNLMPAMYSHRLADIQACARLCGYAISIHGSMLRDLDVIAVPWVKDAETAEKLVHRLCNDLGVVKLDGDPVEKEHGRLAYTLMMGGCCFMDLSVMPLRHEISGNEIENNPSAGAYYGPA